MSKSFEVAIAHDHLAAKMENCRANMWKRCEFLAFMNHVSFDNEDREAMEQMQKTPEDGKGPRSNQFSGWETPKYIAINIFLAFHILAIACWCTPINSPFIVGFRSLVRPYFLWSGLFQSWDMFAPLPKAANSYMEAIIMYQDGNARAEYSEAQRQVPGKGRCAGRVAGYATDPSSTPLG